MVTKPQPPEDLWERLDAAMVEAGVGTHIPEGEGWFTVGDYATARNLPISTARDRLRRLARRGLVETVTGRGHGIEGYYRLKEK